MANILGQRSGHQLAEADIKRHPQHPAAQALHGTAQHQQRHLRRQAGQQQTREEEEQAEHGAAPRTAPVTDLPPSTMPTMDVASVTPKARA